MKHKSVSVPTIQNDERVELGLLSKDDLNLLLDLCAETLRSAPAEEDIRWAKLFESAEIFFREGLITDKDFYHLVTYCADKTAWVNAFVQQKIITELVNS
jgi:hypothetical protein